MNLRKEEDRLDWLENQDWYPWLRIASRSGSDTPTQACVQRRYSPLTMCVLFAATLTLVAVYNLLRG